MEKAVFNVKEVIKTSRVLKNFIMILLKIVAGIPSFFIVGRNRPRINENVKRLYCITKESFVKTR